MANNDFESLTSIDKAARIFKQLCREPHEYKITELAKLTNINRTTLHRIMRVLEAHGLVLKTENNKTYKLGPMTYEMGSAYLNNFKFGDIIFPILDKISHESEEGFIIDTVLYGMSTMLQGFPAYLSAAGMHFFQILLNIIVPFPSKAIL